MGRADVYDTYPSEVCILDYTASGRDEKISDLAKLIAQDGHVVSDTRKGDAEVMGRRIYFGHVVYHKREYTPATYSVNTTRLGVGVEITGRTLVNLLGMAGNFSDLSKVTAGESAVLTLTDMSTMAVVYGLKHLCVTIGDGKTVGFAYLSAQVTRGCYYVALSDVYLYGASAVAVGCNTAGDGNTILASDVYHGFTTSYKKFKPTADGTESLYIKVTGTAGQIAYVDGMRLYEITASLASTFGYGSAQALYDALGSTITNARVIGAMFPYVDSVQYKRDILLTQIGKNLIPPFDSYWWRLSKVRDYNYAEVVYMFDYTINSPYSLTTAATQSLDMQVDSYLLVNVLPNTTYTFSCADTVDQTAYLTFYAIDAGMYYKDMAANYPHMFYGFIGNALGNTKNTNTVTFTTLQNTAQLIVRISGSGTHTFINPQLELGDTATPFEPMQRAFGYTSMQIADGESVFMSPSTSVYKELWEKDIALSTLTWSLDSTGIGYNVIKATLPREAEPGTTTLVNGAGDFVYRLESKAFTGAGQQYNSATILYMSVADSVTDYTNYFSVSHHTAHYKLSKPITHTDTYNSDTTKPLRRGTLSIPQGTVHVEQLSGVVYKEAITPFVANGPNNGGVVLINFVALVGAQTDESYILDYRSKAWGLVYKNGVLDPSWNAGHRSEDISESNIIRGTLYWVKALADYDSTAEYTVTYDRYDKSDSTVSVSTLSSHTVEYTYPYKDAQNADHKVGYL